MVFLHGQVLLSIQGMIFVDDTYFNEPGFERSRGTSAGRIASQRYNKAVAEGTLQHAVLQALQRPTPAFADVIRWARQPSLQHPTASPEPSDMTLHCSSC